MKSYFLLFILFAALSFSCSENPKQNIPVPIKQSVKQLLKTKPSATFFDTLKINFVAAVFYSPDSLQLQKIKLNTDPGAFAANMHEYENLMRNARLIIKRNFKQLKIIEAKNVRYLLFTGSNKKENCIDLDKNYDPYGLYIFNRQKAPQLVDMANVATDIGFYLSK